MKSNGWIARRIIAASVVALGLAIVWAIVIGWCVLIGQTLFPRRAWTNDVLMVTADGTPVISTSRITGNVSLITDQRTLDGKEVKMKEKEWRNWLASAYFPPPYEPPGVVETPLPWNEGEGRLAGVPDGKVPPTAWWIVRDNERTGGVYLAGYDGISKLPIGYIGRSGFRSLKPAEDEQFIVPKSKIEDGFRYVTLSSHYLSTRRLLYSYEIVDPCDIYLLGKEQLWKIDLQERTVQSLLHLDDALAVGSVRVAKATFDGIPVQITKSKSEPPTTDSKNARTERAKATGDKEDDEPEFVLKAVRERDRVVFCTLETGKRKEFVLPEVLRNRRFSVWLLSANKMLVDAHEQGHDEFWSGGPIVRLYWIDPQGKIDQEREVRLAGVTELAPGTLAWRGSVLIPEPIVWVVGTVLGTPLYMLQSNLAADFGSAVGYVSTFAWPPLVTVLVVGIALSWLTLRLQRKYRRKATAAWTLFVFLLSLPGFLAYLVENRRTKLERCPQCGEIVPRDRDACAACNSEFARPVRLGTEIFA